MREITWFDKTLMVLGFLVVIGIFILAFVLYFKGGLCAINPYEYMIANNLTIPNPMQVIAP